MKKFLIVLFTVMLFTVSACGSGNSTTKKSTIAINKNSVYSQPKKPTDLQAKLYNKLTSALKSNSEKKIAQLVAENFCADFFTLKNKSSGSNVGGLTYIPDSYRENFKNYAMNWVYANYQLIVDDKGKSSLPVVKSIKIVSTTTDTIDYVNEIPADETTGTAAYSTTDTYDAYKVKISIAYESTDVDSSDLKTSALVTVFKLDDKFVVDSVK